jgi:hypothetical protein
MFPREIESKYFYIALPSVFSMDFRRQAENPRDVETTPCPRASINHWIIIVIFVIE